MTRPKLCPVTLRWVAKQLDGEYASLLERTDRLRILKRGSLGDSEHVIHGKLTALAQEAAHLRAIAAAQAKRGEGRG